MIGSLNFNSLKMNKAKKEENPKRNFKQFSFISLVVKKSEKVLEELLNNLKGDAVSYKKVKISKVKEKV